jgi:hypothetical protein
MNKSKIVWNLSFTIANVLCYIYLGHHWYNAVVAGACGAYFIDGLIDV